MKDILQEGTAIVNLKELRRLEDRDSGLEWSRVLEIQDHRQDTYSVTVTLEYFTVDHL